MSRLPVFSERVNWWYALGEFALIVAGVLVALGVDSWWQSREQAEREHVYLVQLLADTRENSRRTDAAIAEDSVAGARARRYQQMIQSTEVLPAQDSLSGRIPGPDAFANPDFRPLLGTYNALLETGDLQLLRRASLRFRLVAYLSSIETTRDVVRQSSEQIRGREDVFMRELILQAGGFSRGRGGAGAAIARLRGNQNAALALGSALATRRQRMQMLASLQQEGRVLIQALEAEVGADARMPSATDTVRFPERSRSGPPNSTR